MQALCVWGELPVLFMLGGKYWKMSEVLLPCYALLCQPLKVGFWCYAFLSSLSGGFFQPLSHRPGLCEAALQASRETSTVMLV